MPTETHFPSADVLQGWTPSEGSDHYPLLDTQTGAQYVSITDSTGVTVAATDEYWFTRILKNKTITTVQLVTTARWTNPVALPLVSRIRVGFRIGGVAYYGAWLAVDDGATPEPTVFAVSPATGVAWGLEELNSATVILQGEINKGGPLPARLEVWQIYREATVSAEIPPTKTLRVGIPGDIIGGVPVESVRVGAPGESITGESGVESVRVGSPSEEVTR